MRARKAKRSRASKSRDMLREAPNAPGYRRRPRSQQAIELRGEIVDSLLTTASIFERLSTSLDGELVLPSDPSWDEARTAWNLAVDQRPAAVVLPESTADVAETIRAARSAG